MKMAQQDCKVSYKEWVRCESLEIDLSKVDAPKRILDEAELRLGLPSILVNNAAYSTRDGYEALDAETLDAHYAVNMRGTFLLLISSQETKPNSRIDESNF